jgi:type II secretory pathway pseudopilin PulG
VAIRGRKQKGVSLVEVVSASVCVGVLGAATVAGTTAAKARLNESVLTRQAVALAQNRIEEIRTMGRRAELAPGTKSETVSLADGISARVDIVVEGQPLPNGKRFFLEGLDGDAASVSSNDIQLAELMTLRTLGNNDLSQFISFDGSAATWSFEIEFGSNLRDNASGNDLAPELIIFERGASGAFTIEPIDNDGASLGKSVLVNPTRIPFGRTTPDAGLPNGTGRETVYVVGLDLSQEFGVTEAQRFRITSTNGSEQPDFKIVGMDTTGWPSSSLSSQFSVSGPGTISSYLGPVMFNGIQAGSFASSRIEPVTGVRNFSYSGGVNRCSFYSRPATVWDTRVTVTYEVSSMTGPRQRVVTLDSAISVGTLYN